MEDMKNLIIQSLETKGVLGQIRAHLRSAVFKIVDDQDQQFNTGCGLKWENPTLYKILETKIGTLLAEIIREFMEYFRMDYSLSIFIPECGISPERLKKDEIFGKLGIPNNPENEKFTSGLQLPLLYYIIFYFINEMQKDSKKVIDSIKKIQNDVEKKGEELIEKNYINYLKTKGGEDEDIPLSNNDREVNNDSNKNNITQKKENGTQKNDKVEEDKKEEKKNDKKEEKKNDKKEEKKDNKKENKDNKNEVKNVGDIEEDIVFDDIDDISGGNNSQTISQSQGNDKTVDSNNLEMLPYIENVDKK